MASTFPGVIAFAFMVCMLLAGTVLRAKVPLLRRALVPASLVGGILGFALVSAGLSFGYESRDFTVFTFHFFTLSFMSLCLTGGGRARDRSTGDADLTVRLPVGSRDEMGEVARAFNSFVENLQQLIAEVL